MGRFQLYVGREKAEERRPAVGCSQRRWVVHVFAWLGDSVSHPLEDIGSDTVSLVSPSPNFQLLASPSMRLKRCIKRWASWVPKSKPTVSSDVQSKKQWFVPMLEEKLPMLNGLVSPCFPGEAWYNLALLWTTWGILKIKWVCTVCPSHSQFSIVGSSAEGQEPSKVDLRRMGAPEESGPLCVIGTDAHLFAKKQSGLPWHSSSKVLVTSNRVGWCTSRDLGQQGRQGFFFGFRVDLIIFPSWEWEAASSSLYLFPCFLRGGEKKAVPISYTCVSFLIGLGFSNRPAGCLGKKIKSSMHIACVGLNSTPLPRTLKAQHLHPRLSWAFRLLDNKIKGKSWIFLCQEEEEYQSQEDQTTAAESG